MRRCCIRTAYLPHRGGRVSHALEQLRVGTAMTLNPVTIAAGATVGAALRQVENDPFSTYPVVDERGRFVGMVSEVRLRRTAAEGGVDQFVSNVAQPAPQVEPSHTLVRAVVRMDKSGRRQLAVVDGDDGNRLLGLITMSDVVRAHAQAALEAEEADGSVNL
jgi:CIC family chloride channel protein